MPYMSLLWALVAILVLLVIPSITWFGTRFARNSGEARGRGKPRHWSSMPEGKSFTIMAIVGYHYAVLKREGESVPMLWDLNGVVIVRQQACRSELYHISLSQGMSIRRHDRTISIMPTPPVRATVFVSPETEKVSG